MHSDLVEVGWSEEQWNLIVSAVTEEAQRARVAAQALPVAGPESPTVVSVPKYRLSEGNNVAPPPKRLVVDSEPDLHLTRISVNVYMRTHEVADLELKAALVMFRKAANLIARVEDALVFNGRPGPDQQPPRGVLNPDVIEVGGHGSAEGLLDVTGTVIGVNPPGQGPQLVNAVVAAITALEEKGQLGPYACILGNDLFAEMNNPTNNLVLPRDRVLPFLNGPLLRSSAIDPKKGAVLALSGSPIEIVVATDIGVRYLQTSLEPRFVFRVSERVALRIKDPAAVSILKQ